MSIKVKVIVMVIFSFLFLSLSFGMGYLIAKEANPAPIIIEKANTS